MRSLKVFLKLKIFAKMNANTNADAGCSAIAFSAWKEITSQTDKNFILSSKTYVFEDKMTKYSSSWLIIYFGVYSSADELIRKTDLQSKFSFCCKWILGIY